ncbi:hypothetical protein Pla175_39350 [Pirellulimonas nuda]|uniref:Uncharacterized protein n=1 Tax=Pirellulimonas nuda TaxID=2528009 RepID=A0A518DGD9_9BACT|nr:hypothetical protein [Pirellulimonas nuda]QDU90529.1 hypothetical protein Pla175_39350 [Pirellulimonas nuda]
MNRMMSFDLDDDTAKQLTEFAAQRGLSVDGLIRTWLEESGDIRSAGSSASEADFVAELTPLLFDGPSLPADFSRADIYTDHD